jgi:hypothetical protein
MKDTANGALSYTLTPINEQISGAFAATAKMFSEFRPSDLFVKTISG